jgi:hypothetical protein
MRRLLALLLLAACGPSAECLERCERFGIERTSPQCEELCTEDCATLAETYGMSEDACREQQIGERR